MVLRSTDILSEGSLKILTKPNAQLICGLFPNHSSHRMCPRTLFYYADRTKPFRMSFCLFLHITCHSEYQAMSSQKILKCITLCISMDYHLACVPSCPIPNIKAHLTKVQSAFFSFRKVSVLE